MHPKRAILIGINKYPEASGLPELQYAEADAQDLDNILKINGFETFLFLGSEATYDNLEKALLEYTQEFTGPLLVFFAGHGQSMKSQLHLHPVDSDRAGLKTLTFDQCCRVWQKRPEGGDVVVLLDACRPELGGARGPELHTKQVSRNISAAIAGSRWIEVLFGCSEGQVSYEDSNLAHGVFTDCLLKTFCDNPDYVDTDLLAGATVDRMQEWSERNSSRGRQTACRYHVGSPKRKVILVGDPEPAAWHKAKKTNSVDSYEAYLREYPDGPHAAAAQAALQGLKEAAAWAQAENENTPEAFDHFRDVWPTGRFADAARQRADQLRVEDADWETARKGDDLERYRAFLQNHPNGRHAPVARQRVHEIEDDDRAWDQARQAHTCQALDHYLATTVEEQHRKEAGGFRKILEDDEAWTRASQARDLLAVLDYLQHFGPNARHLAEAERLRSDLDAEETARAEASRKRRQLCRQIVLALCLIIGVVLVEEVVRRHVRNLLASATERSARIRVGATRLWHLGGQTTMEFCGIPGGDFLMGSTKEEREWAAGPEGQGKAEWFADEGDAPRRTPIAQGFWMGRTEVTVGQFRVFVEATQYVTDAEKAGGAHCFDWEKGDWGWVKGKNWRDPENYQDVVREEHPVTCISWHDTMMFCQWLTDRERAHGALPMGMECRLPTEAEWEYACRGGREGTKFWWGDSLAGGQGRLNGASDDKLGRRLTNSTWGAKFPWTDKHAWVSPVDVFEAKGRNGFGLADMLGNVWEWCLDGYDPQGAHEDCWTNDITRRVLRGGSFGNVPGRVRCATRSWYAPTNTYAVYGFRVVLGVGR